jgi:hypothetical protein
MPSNKFAPLVVCTFFVLFLIVSSGPSAFGASSFNDDKRKPQLSKRSLAQKGNFASIGGRVLTVRGKAISHAQVGLYNADTDQWIYARTGTFGQYAFHGLPLSDFYVLVVIQKRYIFLDGSRTFTLEGDMFNVNFMASAPE